MAALTREALVELIEECERNPAAFPELEAALEQIPDDEKARLEKELSLQQQEALQELAEQQSQDKTMPVPRPSPADAIQRLKALEEEYRYVDQLRHVMAMSRLIQRMTPEQMMGLGKEFEALGLTISKDANANVKALYGFYQSYLGRSAGIDPSLMNAMLHNMPASSQVRQFQELRDQTTAPGNFPAQVNNLLANPSVNPSQYLHLAMQMVPTPMNQNRKKSEDEEQQYQAKRASPFATKLTPPGSKT